MGCHRARQSLDRWCEQLRRTAPSSTGIVEKIDFTSGDGADASRHPKLILSYACECGLDCGAPMADDGFILSTLATATLGGLTFTDIDLAEYNRGSDTATLHFDGSLTSLDAEIDALHVLESGNFLLSTMDQATLGGLTFRDGDLVEYDPVTDSAILILDESAVFAGDENIQAVALRSTGTLILSTESDAELGGLSFTDLDLLAIRPSERIGHALSGRRQNDTRPSDRWSTHSRQRRAPFSRSTTMPRSAV